MASEFDKSRLRIETINYHLLDGLILAAKKGSYSDLELSESANCEEYFALHDLLVYVFKEILKERSQLNDYAAKSLRHGGFYYRRICALTGISEFSISFPAEGCVQVDSDEKRIVYRDGRLRMIDKFDFPVSN